jgi:hypothetical protein
MRTGNSQSLAVVPPQAPLQDADFGKVPLQFIPNEGQVEGPAAYYVQGRDKTIYFAAEGLTFVLSGPRKSTSGRWVVKLDFVDANPDAIPVSLEESGAVISYFKGKPENWKAGLSASSKIVYRELWPGIDLLYYGTEDRMRYEFLVHPGADPSMIKLAYRGAESVGLTEEGRLAVTTPVDGFEDDVPLAWQKVKGAYRDVPVGYAVEACAEDETPAAQNVGPESHMHIYGFDVGEYDRSLPLVLDPAVLVYCGFIGGSGGDGGDGIALDSSGNIYVTGYTRSVEATFPVVVGPDLTFNAGPGNGDAYVAKVNSEGTALVYCGYIGGSGFEGGWDIAVDDSGNAYVTGEVGSWEDTFPVIVGPDLTYNGGMYDAFVAKVNAGGTALVYCGYIGGSAPDTPPEGRLGNDQGNGIAVDASGNAYVTGATECNERTFPVTIGPDLTYNGGWWDTFVAKVNADGTGLAYCGYIGGSGWGERGSGIAVDRSGNAYVTGETDFPVPANFPVTVGPDLTPNGGFDAFVAKVNAAGTALVYCGYIGGLFHDYGYEIAVDDSGNAYVTGETESAETSFPVKVGPDLSYNGGFRDAFVAKVNSAGTTLVYCGYIGGSDWDIGFGIAVDGSGHAYITGRTGSTEADFPAVDGPGLTYHGVYDAFVAKVNAVGTALVYSGYIGGSDVDNGIGIAVDGSGNAYVAGSARNGSGDLPVIVGPDLTHNGGEYDAFVAKISSFDVSDPAVTSLSPSETAAGDPGFTISVAGTGFEDGAVVRWDGSDRPTAFLGRLQLSAEIGAADLGTVKTVAVTVRNPDGGVSNAAEFRVNNPVPALSSLSPAKATAGRPNFILTLQGSNFVPPSVALWGGSAKTTTYVSGTELQAAVLAGDIATAGEIQVTVANPAPGGGTSNAVSFAVAGFSIGASPASVTVTAGQSAAYTIQLTPQFGSFDSPVTFICSGLPSKCAASFSPTSVTPGANPASTTLTLKTTARTEAATGGMFGASTPIPPALGFLILIPAIGLGFRFRKPVSARLHGRWLTAAALICVIGLIASCSADGDNTPPSNKGTPAGTYQITVQGESGIVKTSTKVTLLVN